MSSLGGLTLGNGKIASSSFKHLIPSHCWNWRLCFQGINQILDSGGTFISDHGHMSWDRIVFGLGSSSKICKFLLKDRDERFWIGSSLVVPEKHVALLLGALA